MFEWNGEQSSRGDNIINNEMKWRKIKWKAEKKNGNDEDWNGHLMVMSIHFDIHIHWIDPHETMQHGNISFSSSSSSQIKSQVFDGRKNDALKDAHSPIGKIEKGERINV